MHAPILVWCTCIPSPVSCKAGRLTGCHGGLHGDEARLAAHQLDEANALARAARLYLSSQQCALRLFYCRVKAKAPAQQGWRTSTCAGDACEKEGGLDGTLEAHHP
eukprot:1158120-Pelagomonas_calceolata.AAC.6